MDRDARRERAFGVVRELSRALAKSGTQTPLS